MRTLFFALAVAASVVGCASKPPPPPKDASSHGDPPSRGAGGATTDAERDKEAAMLLAAQVRITSVMAQAIRVGAAVWQTANAGCPKPNDVVGTHMVPEAVRAEDAWDTPFKIVCGAKSPTVISAGPDRAFDTKDDVVAGDR